MLGVAATHRLERGLVGLVLQDEVTGELAGLDAAEDAAHPLLGVGVDDDRAGDVVAVLGGLGDGVAHAGQATLVHEVDDELQLVEALEVGDLGLVAGLDEHLEPGLDKRGGATAEDGLLTEQVGLGLLLESGLDHAGAGAADALGVGQRQVLGLAGGVLVHREDAGHAGTLGVDAADHVARALGGDHADVDVGRGLDLGEVDVEAVREEQRVAGLEARGDLLGVELGLGLVRHEDHDDVGLLGGVGHARDLQARLAGGLTAGGSLVEADDDLHTAVGEVAGVGVALGAVADDGHGLALEQAEVGGVVVVHRCGHCVVPSGRAGVVRTGSEWSGRCGLAGVARPEPVRLG